MTSNIQLRTLAVSLGHQSKLNIMSELYSSTLPLRQYEIANRIDKDDSTVQYHLNQLEKMAIVQKDEQGPMKIYTLSPLGKELVEMLQIGNTNEEQQIDLRTRELAAIIGLDVNSKTFYEIKEKITEWYDNTKVISKRVNVRSEKDGG